MQYDLVYKKCFYCCAHGKDGSLLQRPPAVLAGELRVVRANGIEPSTSSMSRKHSATELRAH